jgi:hypothetical protein
MPAWNWQNQDEGHSSTTDLPSSAQRQRYAHEKATAVVSVEGQMDYHQEYYTSL